MKEHIHLVEQQFPTICKNHLLPLAKMQIVELQSLCKQYGERLLKERKPALAAVEPTGNQSIQHINERIQLRKDIACLLTSWAPLATEKASLKTYKVFEQEMDTFISELPLRLSIPQKAARFNAQPEDGHLLSMLKAIKRLFRLGKQMGLSMLNFMRRLFRQPPLQSIPWKQTVHLQAIARRHLIREVLPVWAASLDRVFLEVNVLYHQLWLADEKLYALHQERQSASDLEESLPDQIIPSVEETNRRAGDLLLQAEQDIMALSEQALSRFKDYCQLGSTIEARLQWHRHWRDGIRQDQALKRLKKQLDRRRNTLVALADDWKFNQYIYLYKDQTRQNLWQLNAGFDMHCSHLQLAAEGFLAQIESLAASLQNEKEAAGDRLSKLRYQIKIKLSGEQTDYMEQQISEHNLLLVIEAFERKINNRLDEFPSLKHIVRRFDPRAALERSALQAINPRELLAYKSIPLIHRATAALKPGIMQAAEDLRNEARNAGKVLLYHAESAQALLQDENKEAESIALALEGVEKTQNRLREKWTQFAHGASRARATLEEANRSFSEKLMELRDNENVLDIRLGIIRAKTRSGSARLGRSFTESFQQASHWAKKWHRLGRMKFRSSSAKFFDRFGIRAPRERISTELTEFLARGKTAMEQLPFIYRRLFKLEPLQDEAFFFPRKREVAELNAAYRQWKNASFMPVLVTGEKGSGVTSMIKLFQKQCIKEAYPVYTCPLDQRILSEEHFMQHLGHYIRRQAFVDLNDFLAWWEENGQGVVVLDGLQRMYLRQHGGTNLLKKLMEVISLTRHQVFWICTCSLYASRFLDNTMGLYGYFPSVISMKTLSAKEIVELIMLRHQASGYKLVFEPGEEDLRNKPFRRLPPEAQAEKLREAYFDSLHKLTRSNIAFALVLWVRSTARISETAIHLRSLQGIDFSFLQNLDDDTLFCLHALIIHDGLEVGQLAGVLNFPNRQVHLTLMRLKNQAIVHEQNGQFLINPLLYKITVDLLKQKNIIH